MAFSEHLLITAIMVSVAFSFVLYAYEKRKINTSALIGTFALGVIILLTFGLEFGYIGLLALLTFFLVGNWVTRYKYDKKAELGVAEGNKGMRGIPNVLGNGLAPLIFAVLYAVSRESYSTLFLLGFSGAVATACADTFSTEIGEAEGNPRLITTFKKVPVGTSGGISLPGLGAAVLGSFLISIVCLAFVSSGDKAPIRSIFFSVCLISGFLGCIADSIFGATIEDKPFYKKRLRKNASLQQTLGKFDQIASQFRLNKHHVNVLATLSGGLFAVLLGYAFGVQMV